MTRRATSRLFHAKVALYYLLIGCQGCYIVILVLQATLLYKVGLKLAQIHKENGILVLYICSELSSLMVFVVSQRLLSFQYKRLQSDVWYAGKLFLASYSLQRAGLIVMGISLGLPIV